MMRHLRIVTPAIVSVVLLTASGNALAQSSDARGLADTLARLERQLQALERTVYRGAPAPADRTEALAGSESASGAAVAKLQLTTGELEEQLRRLTGQVEQLDFQVRQINQRLDRLVADVDFRLRNLEQGTTAAEAPRGSTQPIPPSAPRAPGAVTVEPSGNAGAPRVIGTLTESQLRAAGVDPNSETETETASTGAPTEEPASPSTLPPGNPREQYDYAYQFLLQRDFVGAEAALSAFVSTNPEDTLAGNAQYWLGETFYVRGDYTTAARAFAEGFQRYPDSTKAPDNLLKLGMSLAKLEQNDDACITLKKLRVEYPDAPTSIVQRADREIGRLQCN